MKTLRIAMLLALTMAAQPAIFAMETSYSVKIQNINPVETAFSGTVDYDGNAKLSGHVTHVSVKRIDRDLRYAPETEIAWFPDVYAITVVVGDKKFFAEEQNIQYVRKEHLTLWDFEGSGDKMLIGYADSITGIVDATSFENSLKHLFGLYEGCPTPATQFTTDFTQ